MTFKTLEIHMASHLFALSLTTFILFFNTALAQQPKPLIKIKKTPFFDLPIDCIIGESCWVMNYVDMGADDGKKTDPACQERTYDSHKGTDFMILDEIAMKKGVNVIAPLDGTVTKVRDGEEDIWADEAQLKMIQDQRKECGNAVMVDHGDDFKTIYCHMKKDSIKVKPNQEIKKGDKLGEVGLSGFTQFPHLHFGILQENKIIDPFTGQQNTQSCGKRKASLWSSELDLQYQPIIIPAIGFSDNIPALDQIERDTTAPSIIPQDADLLAFWIVALGVQEGDKITLEIKDPNDKIYARRDITQDNTRARQFYYTGRRTQNEPLKEGVYTGTITIKRDYKDTVIQEEEFTAILVSSDTDQISE